MHLAPKCAHNPIRKLISSGIGETDPKRLGPPMDVACNIDYIETFRPSEVTHGLMSISLISLPGYIGATVRKLIPTMSVP